MMDLDNIPDTQTEAEELEEVVMGLIINSGQARSLAYAALKQAKQGDFAAASVNAFLSSITCRCCLIALSLRRYTGPITLFSPMWKQ